jgi:tetratricopeptide (TPR) repeat protein
MISDLQDLGRSLPTGKNLPPQPPRPFRHSISQRLRTGFVDIVRHPYLLALVCFLTALIGFSIYMYQEIYQEYPPTPTAKMWYDKGTEALNNGEPFKAKTYFEEAINSDEVFAMAYARHAETLFELGNIEEARTEIAKARDTLKNSGYFLLNENSIRFQAISDTLLSEHADAIKNYQKIASYASDTEKGQAFLDLGMAFDRNEDLAKAIENYNKALTYDPNLYSAYVRLGELYGRQQDRSKSVGIFHFVSQFYNVESDAEGKIEVDYALGLLLSSLDDPTKVRSGVENALKEAEANGITYQQIKCLILLSKILRSSGEKDDALSYAEQAVSVALQNGNNDLHAQSLLELGTVYLFQQKKEKAQNTYEEALGIARQYGLTVVEKRTLLQLGSLHVGINHEADQALDYTSQVEDFFRQGNYKKEIFDLLSIKAQALTIKGDLPAAIDIYTDLSTQADEVGNRLIQGRAQKGSGTIMYDNDDFSRALEPLYNSFAIFNSINRTSEAGYSWFLYADALLQLGHYQEAETALFQAEGLAQKNPGLTPRIDLIKAKEALIKRQFAAAIKICGKMISEDPKAGNEKTALPSTVEARTLLALAFARTGEKAKAKTLIEKIDLGGEFEEKDMLAKTYLARAEIMLDNGRNDLAADAAQKAQEQFNGLRKPAFEWQAWLLLSQAQNRLKDTDAAKASSANWAKLFSTLKQIWGEENFKSYSERPDIKYYRKAFSEF